MKKLGEDLATLFAQYSSVEFLSSLLSCLSDENASGLSDVLKVTAVCVERNHCSWYCRTWRSVQVLQILLQ